MHVFTVFFWQQFVVKKCPSTIRKCGKCLAIFFYAIVFRLVVWDPKYCCLQLWPKMSWFRPDRTGEHIIKGISFVRIRISKLDPLMTGIAQHVLKRYVLLLFKYTRFGENYHLKRRRLLCACVYKRLFQCFLFREWIKKLANIVTVSLGAREQGPNADTDRSQE